MISAHERSDRRTLRAWFPACAGGIPAIPALVHIGVLLGFAPSDISLDRFFGSEENSPVRWNFGNSFLASARRDILWPKEEVFNTYGYLRQYFTRALSWVFARDISVRRSGNRFTPDFGVGRHHGVFADVLAPFRGLGSENLAHGVSQRRLIAHPRMLASVPHGRCKDREWRPSARARNC